MPLNSLISEAGSLKKSPLKVTASNTAVPKRKQLLRASIAHYPNSKPDNKSADERSYKENIEIFTDGALVIEDSIIRDIGDYATVVQKYPDAAISDYFGQMDITRVDRQSPALSANTEHCQLWRTASKLARKLHIPSGNGLC